MATFLTFCVLITTFCTTIRSDEETRTDIAYSQIGPGVDEGLFSIGRKNGYIKIYGILDREKTAIYEKQEMYKLIITGTDVDGSKSDPKNITGTVTINVLDVNDNIPILEKNSYEGSVEENTMNMEAIRIKAIDKDKIHTENWEAVYTIISVNEAGYFNITTNPKTNEGILIVT